MPRGGGETNDDRHVADALGADEEPVGGPGAPPRARPPLRRPVEGRVQLDGVEELRVVAKPAAGGRPGRIEHAAAPVRVRPAGAADPDGPRPATPGRARARTR